MTDAEQTEDPTPKRQREAREEGNVAKSSEFTGVAVMVTALDVLIFWTASMVRQLAATTVQAIRLATRPDLSKATFVMAAFISFVQVGAIFTPSVLLPDAGEINPVQGLTKMFSKDRAVELAKNLLKIAIMGTIGYLVLSAN
ncbi:MAG: EscU/YscU/HrcU family type III secretion system export apparatus switch protein, partial [Bradymonadaceae bacterium]